jgi:hypothetical protein
MQVAFQECGGDTLAFLVMLLIWDPHWILLFMVTPNVFGFSCMLQSVAMDGISSLNDAPFVGNTDYFTFLRVDAHHPTPLTLLYSWAGRKTVNNQSITLLYMSFDTRVNKNRLGYSGNLLNLFHLVKQTKDTPMVTSPNVKNSWEGRKTVNNQSIKNQ